MQDELWLFTSLHWTNWFAETRNLFLSSITHTCVLLVSRFITFLRKFGQLLLLHASLKITMHSTLPLLDSVLWGVQASGNTLKRKILFIISAHDKTWHEIFWPSISSVARSTLVSCTRVAECNAARGHEVRFKFCFTWLYPISCETGRSTRKSNLKWRTRRFQLRN